MTTRHLSPERRYLIMASPSGPGRYYSCHGWRQMSARDNDNMLPDQAGFIDAARAHKELDRRYGIANYTLLFAAGIDYALLIDDRWRAAGMLSTAERETNCRGLSKRAVQAASRRFFHPLIQPAAASSASPAGAAACCRKVRSDSTAQHCCIRFVGDARHLLSGSRQASTVGIHRDFAFATEFGMTALALPHFAHAVFCPIASANQHTETLAPAVENNGNSAGEAAHQFPSSSNACIT